MRNLILVAAVVLINAMSALTAGGVEMQPGLWELTTKVERDGVASTRPLYARCVTADSAKAAHSATARDIDTGFKSTLGASPAQEACKLTDVTNDKNLMTWRLQCTGGTSAQKDYTARFDSPRHYVETTKTSITVNNKTFTVVETTEGRYKGECPR